ncbi:hypothetical protein E4U56_000313 [Claviceps arundinis]|uniref:Uncharacterized protein n=1 Tax=Claviceps arundinis TaxID=1623583 RepID=A0A9P7MTJ4_9HYPO|nr:hypothetical protein E4U56_000313 [Claviceps arundinis]
MCYTIRHCRHGHTILTTEHASCAGGPPLRKRDAFIAASPRANTQGAERPEPELDESCPVCRGEAEAEAEAEDEEEAVDDEDDDAEEHSSMKTHACHTPGRISPHAEPEPTTWADQYDLERNSSHESTNPDDIPALSRNSQSTWTSSTVCSLRGSTDFAASHDEEDLRIRIVDSLTPTNASQQDLDLAGKAVPLGAMRAQPQRGGILLSATQSAMSLHHPHGDGDGDGDGVDGPGREISAARSSSGHAEADGGEHRHKFAKFWGWKQAKSGEHKRDKTEVKGTRPEKKSRSGWKAIMLRSRSVDSDRSFVCVTAKELLNQELQRRGQDMEDPTLRGG